MTDEQLVEKYKRGDESAFDEIYERYKKATIFYARSVYVLGAELEDVIQYGMIGLFNAVAKYNGKSSFKNFAFMCIRNAIFKGTKKHLSNKNLPLNTSVELQDYENVLTTPEDTEEQIILKEALDILMKKATKVLSEFELDVLKLYMEGYTYTEIAEQLKKTPKTCDNALQRIKKKLSGEK